MLRLSQLNKTQANSFLLIIESTQLYLGLGGFYLTWVQLNIVFIRLVLKWFWLGSDQSSLDWIRNNLSLAQLAKRELVSTKMNMDLS